MINLEIDLSVAGDLEDDVEAAVTSSVERLCGADIRALAYRLREDGNIYRAFGHRQLGDGPIPTSIKEHTEHGMSVLGRMLTGEAVELNIRGSEVVVERSNVLSNVLALLLPILSDDTMATLLSDWGLTNASSHSLFHRAVVENYLQTPAKTGPCESLSGTLPDHTRDRVRIPRYSEYTEHTQYTRPDTLEALVQERATFLAPEADSTLATGAGSGAGAGAGAWPWPGEREFDTSANKDQADKLVRVLYRMLTANHKSIWLRTAKQTEACGHCSLTHRYGLLPPELDCIRDPTLKLSVCFASWYLSTADQKDIVSCFQTALAGGRDPGSNQSAFINVLVQHSHELLCWTAPNCRACTQGCGHHYGGGCGTRELMACLTQQHSLQLLELLVCHGQRCLLDDEAIIWSEFGL